MIKVNKLYLFLIFFTSLSFIVPIKFINASFIGVSPSVLPSTNCVSGISCGLVGYWTFDGKDMVGGVARDRSGNGNNGNLINIATSTFYTLGKIGQGFNFDGVDDYVNINSSTSLSPTARITMSAWVRPNKQSSVAYMAVIEKSLSYNMYIRQDGIVLVFLTGVNNWVTTSGSIDLFNGGWHHIVTTYDGTTQILYIDNKLISSTSASGSITTNSNAVKIGDSGGVPVKGLIDDVRIYNRGLSVSEISQLYSSGVSNKQNSASVITATTTCSVGLSCGLVTYWTFDGKDIVNGVVRDNSGNGTFANIGNIASSTFYTTGVRGQALRFDTGSNYIYSDLGTARSTFTISLWYTPKVINSWNGNQTGFHMGKTAYAESFVFRWYSTGGSPKIQASSNNGNTGNLSSTYGAETRLPYLNTFVYTPTQIDWYINGVLYNSTTPSVGTFDAMRFIRLGGTGNASQGSNGVIDEFRMYDRALSSSEIKQLYASVISTKQSSSQNIIQNSSCISGLSCGLVGYWTFDGKDMVGGVARDRSGNNDLNSSNISTSTFYSLGKIGQGLKFDGTDDVLTKDSPTNLTFNTAFTLSAWIKTGSKVTTAKEIVGRWDGIEWGYMLAINENSSDHKVKIVLDKDVGGGSRDAARASVNAVNDDKWHHIVGVYDGPNTRLDLYVDGVLSTASLEGTIPASISSQSRPIYIGNDNGATRAYQGSIDDVRIYNRAISSTEVLQLYNLGK